MAVSNRGVVAAKAALHALALAPMALLAWRIRLVWTEADIDALGPDPVAAIEHALGLWALRLLLLTLAVSPLRQLTGRPVLLQFRRMLGLYAFAYASLHFAAYLVLDLRGWWTLVFEEIVKRPYITVGFAAWLLLVPLAITSTRGWMRRLGRRWGQLHRLVYAIGVLAVLHFWWIVKSDYREPLLYAAILAVLLGWRAWKRVRRPVPGASPPRAAPRPAVGKDGASALSEQEQRGQQ
ncbi:protein-methionine-sulfoxide reductase heme-binding subunit MsrQ [Luteimonas composti]|uniref:Protein-methionine-sulfoxide reductase heme-binding subunit MsrQ n=1 Tax=Luteimonas composti TaxID=398257 RepID=A0ABT6MMD2_9GAMM|nr:protein-methionine-sulfoxide reductase heme-binding subunit MsrQ [Luteimonas composti]MDH7451771.1 protein-methionine-sulfoxide reductase heme-binding subunit MsrQ [Luteimonas composti]